MRKTAMIRARTEPQLKNKVERIFHTLGLTASEAINLFYHRVELEKGLPFDMKIPNAVTLRAISEVEKKKKLPTFNNVDDMLNDLKK
ncbi:MAG: type II toxin-antitoxin system RelB/DinJ family antitoxin [Candidatus Moranbacteria bacterium]|nr:type II toxin-antitoxin system RelB/DinJ family antitoxin [Candidatus Moranbacteria bacterium]